MSNKRKKWFIDRIGKKVFRGKGTCFCDSCMRSYFNGIVIQDEFHAGYLCDVEIHSDSMHYFDTMEEMIEYEKTIA